MNFENDITNMKSMLDYLQKNGIMDAKSVENAV